MTKENDTAKCAQCKKSFNRKDIPHEIWPFCSKRCKMIDLGQWLSEKYVLNDNEENEDKISPDEEDND